MNINEEKEIISLMINLYCRKNHKQNNICTECSSLLDYTFKRIENCPQREVKTFCSSCKTHCYKKDMREKIRKVMRFSGPRMIFYHPVLAVKHIIDKTRS